MGAGVDGRELYFLLGRTLAIRWSALLSNWILQTAPALPASSNTWSVVTNPRSTVGDEIEVLYPISATSAFFRLKSP